MCGIICVWVISVQHIGNLASSWCSLKSSTGSTWNVPQASHHVVCKTLNRQLAEADFDRRVENFCEPYYAERGRPGIGPGVFFHTLLIGYFENIVS